MTKQEQITLLTAAVQAGNASYAALKAENIKLKQQMQDRRVPELIRLMEANARLAEAASKVLAPHAW